MDIIEESLNIKKISGTGVILIYVNNINQVLNVIIQTDNTTYTVHDVKIFDTERQCFNYIIANSMIYNYFSGTYNDVVEQYLSEGDYAFCTDDSVFYVMRENMLVPLNGN